MWTRYESLFLRVCILCLIFFCCSVNYAADSVHVTNATEIQDTKEPEVQGVKDPLENFNRGIFYFNDKVDFFITKPIATFYIKVIPKPLNQGIHNFFANINTVTTIANDILQLHFYQMMNDLWRLGLNTTFGIGGLFDVASLFGLKPYANDFGLTLARWGWKESIFIVWPLFGPSTLRDGIEIPVDYYAFSVYPHIQSDAIRLGLYGLGVIDRRAQLLKYQSVLDEVAIDKYVFIRDAYLQRRRFQIRENAEKGLFHQPNDIATTCETIPGADPGAKRC